MALKVRLYSLRRAVYLHYSDFFLVLQHTVFNLHIPLYNIYALLSCEKRNPC